MYKPLASLLAIVATSALLVADSAGPQCAEYETFQGTYDFETTCGGGASGEVTMHIDLDHYFGEPSSEQKVSSSAATIDNVFADYDLSECSYDGEGGTGLLRTVDFEIWVQPADTGAEPMGFSCLGLNVHDRSAQLLPCVPFVQDEAKCTVTMTHR